MTPELYERVKRLFLAVRMKSIATRAEWLDEACEGDPMLRAEVESLLAHQEHTGNPLDTSSLQAPAEELLAEGTVKEPSPHPKRIGSYQIIGVLGAGGMGRVYLAEQERPKRIVALKVLRSAANSPAMLRRFEQEAQVLALLMHPGIAQIYEVGTDDSGDGPQPFFAMELIKGEALTAFVAKNGSNVKTRIQLFIKVCDAIHHAHQKGVIHRDLKPANILVDEQGNPKILDFGVARVTEADLKLSSLDTSVGQLVGTLSYMSPEQARGDPRELDTRSDVYALGVILHELLSGCMPFDLEGKTIPEAVRIILEEDPIPLSAVNRIFQGDLETIVAKALEKQKNRRYQSASELASDLLRYMTDEPILAHPPSTVYQLQKFAKRHRTLVSMVGVAFLTLIVGLITTTWQAAAAQRARVDAESEAEITALINRFLNEDLLAWADPDNSQKYSVTVKEVLDRASIAIEGRFADQPKVEAAIRSTLGNAYRSLGEYAEAGPHLLRALNLRRQHLGEEHLDTLDCLNDLGWLYEDQGRFEEAEPIWVKVLEARRRILGDEHEDTLISSNNLGCLYAKQMRIDEAEPILVATLEARRKFLGEDHSETLRSMHNLADFLRVRGRFKEAESLCLEVLERQRRTLGEEHLDTLASSMNLARLYVVLGKNGEAERIYLQVLEVRRRVLGERHPQTCDALMSVGGIYFDEGRYADAEQLFRQVLAIHRETLGADHPQTLLSITSLGSATFKQHQLSEAEPLYREALEGWRRTSGDEHPQTAFSLNNLGNLYLEQGRFDLAEPLLLEAYEILRRVRGEDHVNTISAMHNVGVFYLNRLRFAEAEDLLLGAVEGARRAIPEGSPQLARNLRDYAACLMRMKRYDEAEENLFEAYDITVETFGEDSPFTQDLITGFVTLYEAMGQLEDLEEWRSKLESPLSSSSEWSEGSKR